MSRVAYFYDSDIGNFHYGPGHPMKPHRIRMTHNLLLNYGLYKKMEIYRPHYASDDEMSRFHSDDYLNFLRLITPDNQYEYARQLHRFNVGEDCPVFPGLYEYCQIAAGGSVAGAMKLNHGQADIAINWAGGLHHAKKSEAAGFCYVNDIVLGILELLKVHERVVYIDCDIHHGDGVEEAFYTSDRVMTVSFHKFGKFYPGSGALRDIGAEEGRNYSLNFPLKDGMDDAAYESIFKPVMAAVMERFQPGAVVLQLGADSLAGDRLGCFNLTIDGHAESVRFMKTFNVPLLVLGGGGYTIRNVARCWAYETAVLLDTDIPDEIPFCSNFSYYGPTFTISIDPSNMPNLNSREELEKTTAYLLQVLHQVEPAPSAQMLDVPPDTYLGELDEDKEDPDVRLSQSLMDKLVEHKAELYDEPEGSIGRGARNVDSIPAAASGALTSELQTQPNVFAGSAAAASSSSSSATSAPASASAGGQGLAPMDE